jgi:hypothetical protein
MYTISGDEEQKKKKQAVVKTITNEIRRLPQHQEVIQCISSLQPLTEHALQFSEDKYKKEIEYEFRIGVYNTDTQQFQSSFPYVAIQQILQAFHCYNNWLSVTDWECTDDVYYNQGTGSTNTVVRMRIQYGDLSEEEVEEGEITMDEGGDGDDNKQNQRTSSSSILHKQATIKTMLHQKIIKCSGLTGNLAVKYVLSHEKNISTADSSAVIPFLFRRKLTKHYCLSSSSCAAPSSSSGVSASPVPAVPASASSSSPASSSSSSSSSSSPASSSSSSSSSSNSAPSGSPPSIWKFGIFQAWSGQSRQDLERALQTQPPDYGLECEFVGLHKYAQATQYGPDLLTLSFLLKAKDLFRLISAQPFNFVCLG